MERSVGEMLQRAAGGLCGLTLDRFTLQSNLHQCNTYSVTVEIEKTVFANMLQQENVNEVSQW